MNGKAFDEILSLLLLLLQLRPLGELMLPNSAPLLSLLPFVADADDEDAFVAIEVKLLIEAIYELGA